MVSSRGRRDEVGMGEMRGDGRGGCQETRQTKACLNIKRTIRYALKYASSRLSSISFVCLLGIVSLHFSRLQTHAHTRTHPRTHTHCHTHLYLVSFVCACAYVLSTRSSSRQLWLCRPQLLRLPLSWSNGESRNREQNVARLDRFSQSALL